MVSGSFDADGTPDAASAAYTRAVEQGFYDRWFSDEHLERLLQALAPDEQQLLGVFPDPGFTGLEPWGEFYHQLGFGPDYPVGTFVDYDKTLNAGGAEPLPARLITGVTVNPAFRRRGILTHMMTSRLAQAVADDIPLAALTVSEGSIYGRFGFGPATREQKVELNTTATADGIRFRTPPAGRVIPVDPSRSEDVQKQTFAAFHAATRGSVERQPTYWKLGTARWDPENISSWNRRLRAIVHVKDDGSLGGYAVFSFEGWDQQPHTMTVRDMITVDTESRIELLRHLGQMDMVDRVVFQHSYPVQDPALQALVNPRACRITSLQDMLWVRILNPVTALESRQWSADGEFSLQLTDPLGIAAGTFTVSVSGAVAQVTSASQPAAAEASTPQHFQMDIETLSSLYLGDASVLTLRDAGRITASEDADWSAFSATFDLPTPPFCATHF